MPKKKKVPRSNPDRRKPGHYNAILLEEVRSDFKFVIEHVDGVEKRLTQKMDDRFDKVEAELQDHRRILQQHSVTLQRHGEILGRHGEILDRHGEKLDRLEQRLDGVEQRLDRVEHKLDKVADSVAHHDKEIVELKTAVSSH